MEMEEFLQSKNEKSIKERMECSIEKCVSIKGAVAFWSINAPFISGLAEKLALNNSYMCVDIHEPTNIDSLNSLIERNANIYLFMYRKDNGKYPLMHAKFILFDLGNGQVEIWLGSQNITKQALEGENIESTVIITTDKDSVLYRKMVDYLGTVKRYCEEVGGNLYKKIGKKFNSEYVDFYKMLQGSFDFQEKTHQVMDVICADVEEFQKGTEDSVNNYTIIAIYNNKNPNKKTSIDKNKELLIRALDRNGSVCCYKFKIHSFFDELSPMDTQTGTIVTTYRIKEKTYTINHYTKIM
ncbi:phospholipase D-like domain-containing protein [Thioflexithrix psekupsensis]|uniref:Phospholipase D-like domain-containing protein n=1 Tax=Thioflexithrix psekupsensis TaxID=1570016 RepID=A0A251X6K8_9GAMM|nr:phospholipase D-like domain-containing protein [Thioflexithrix psekupsensis]OUD13252.1 hypothetical protein TPSD3_11515 [Thioflexithrix psekupsensis]